jgi:hypothetical protein
MTLPTRLFGTIAVAATAVSLAIPGVAGAKAGDKTFQQTYPLASKVCAKVAAGTESKHLKRFAAQVTADCTTLLTGFTTAQSTVIAARATLTAQIAADRALTAAACPTPHNQPATCFPTRAGDDAAIEALNKQLAHAIRHYYRTIEAGRDHFWKAIKALPGERHVHADAPIPVLPD